MVVSKCFVRDCPNTSESGKILFTVPKGEVRKKWLALARSSCTSLKSSLRCCEDHFDVEKDVENWIQNKLMLANQKKPFPWILKKGTVPHIFNCQPDRKRAHAAPPRSAVEKRKRISVLQDITNVNHQRSAENSHVIELPETEGEEAFVLSQPSNDESRDFNNLSVNVLPVEVDVLIHSNLEGTVMEVSESAHNIAAAVPQPSIETVAHNFQCQTVKKFKDAQTQTHFNFRSEYTQTNIIVSKDSETQTTQGKVGPYEVYSMEELEKSFSELNSSLSTGEASTSEYVPSEEHNTSADTLPDEIKELQFGLTVINANVQIMEKYPKVYLGLDQETMCVVSLLEKHGGLEKLNIYIALRKIRLNESSEILGHIFRRDRSTICKILNATIPQIARFMATCIRWPNPEIIQSNVPIAFRANYSRVQSILDCFEIEIEKFSNPLFQSLTWSDYKKRNTIKFLISSTPDGLINFISRAYGGRATDCNIIRDSGLLEIMPKNIVIMADRGFKNVESIISECGSRLVRPPSVQTAVKKVPDGSSEKITKETVKMTKSQVRETKVIASLRIVIERVIGRLRDFDMVDHAANFHHDLLSLANDIVIITCGLSNLQGPFFR